MREPSSHASALLSRLDGVSHLDLAVLEKRTLVDGVVEVRLGGAPDALRPWPGQDVMIGVSDDRGEHRWRRYTVRAIGSGVVTLWVTTDTGGPGARWVASAQPGDRVEGIGPRGKIAVFATASSHLFVVDESGLAASAVMAEALGEPASTHLVAPGQALEPAAPRLQRGVRGARSALPPSTETVGGRGALGELLGSAVASLPAPVAAYVFGELALVRQARSALSDAGVAADLVAAKAYWRADRSNESHGEPARDSE